MNPRNFIVVLLMIAMLCTAACTTTRSVAPTQEAAVAHDIKPGDEVTLKFMDETEQIISVTALSDDGIRGIAADASVVEARWGELHQVEIRRVSTGKTAGVALAAVGATVLIIGAALESVGPGLAGY